MYGYYYPKRSLSQNKLLWRKPPEARRAKGGAPKEIRTPNLLIRSQVLYPIELWVLGKDAAYSNKARNRLQFLYAR